MNQRARPSDRPPFALVAALLRSGKLTEADLDAALKEAGLTQSKMWALLHLVRAGGSLTVGRLAERMECTRSNATQLVDRLEADNLVRRLPDPTDRRGVVIDVTAEGRRRHDDGFRLTQEVERRFAAGLSPTEHEQLLALLDRVGVESVNPGDPTPATPATLATTDRVPSMGRRPWLVRVLIGLTAINVFRIAAIGLAVQALSGSGDVPLIAVIGGFGDFLVGLCVPVLVFALVRRRGPLVWGAAIAFHVYAFTDYIFANAATAIATEGESLEVLTSFGGAGWLAALLLVSTHLVSLVLLTRPGVVAHYLTTTTTTTDVDSDAFDH